MQINSYSSAISSYQQSTMNVSKSTQQVATGNKINSAADDNPAYSVILQNLAGKTTGSQQTYSNVQDSTSPLSTSGAMSDLSTPTATEGSINTITSTRQQLSTNQSQTVLGSTNNNQVQSDRNLQNTKEAVGDTDISAAVTSIDANKIKQYANIYAMKQNTEATKNKISLLA